MAWVGSAFQRVYSWVTDRDANIPITASRMDTEMDGIATGISACIHKGGNNAATANLPMGGYKHTNVAAATARTEYARASQIQDGDMTYAADTGSADAYAIALSPTITAYATGMVVSFKAANANTGASTLDIDSVGAATIKKWNDRDLQVGDIEANGVYQVQYDGTNFQLISPVSFGVPILSADGVLAPHKNLRITNGATADDQITVTVNEITLNDGSFNFVRASGSPITVSNADITTSAVTTVRSGYLEASVATRGTSKWHHAWLLSNGTASYVGFTEATVTNGVAVMPSLNAVWDDYFYGLIGAVRTNAIGNFVRFEQVNIYVANDEDIALSGGASTTVTAISSFGSYVPEIATSVYGHAGAIAGAAGDIGSGNIYTGSSNDIGKIQIHSSNAGTDPEYSHFEAPMYTPQTLYYNVASGDSLNLYVSGWKY